MIREVFMISFMESYLFLCVELGAGSQHQVRLDVEEDELDEETRRFNFWTHQVHIFFTRKFFPAAEHLIGLNKFLEQKHLQVRLQCISLFQSVQCAVKMFYIHLYVSLITIEFWLL